MPTFLTVKEAAEQTGKSPSSIRRVLYPILKNDKHADRKHVQPSADEALQLRMKGDNFAWRVSEEFLLRTIPTHNTSQHGTSHATPKSAFGQADSELIAMLRRELDIKNQQIAQQAEAFSKQMELMSGLSERMHEGNVLIASLQQRLALTDGRDTKTPEHVKTKVTTPPKPEKGTVSSAKPQKGTAATAKVAKPRRGFLARLFRPSP